MTLNDDIEVILIHTILNNEDFCREALPHIQSEYFESRVLGEIYSNIFYYVSKYNHRPAKEAILIQIKEKSIDPEIYKEIVDVLSNLDAIKPQNVKFVRDAAERWMKDRAYYLAIKKAAEILQNKDKKTPMAAVSEMIDKAAAKTFDPRIGLDFMDDIKTMYENRHEAVERIPFDLKYFNKITKGGMKRKTVNVVLAGTGVGKTLFLCHTAASTISEGKNVLYITLEMSRDEIARRIDSNMMNLNMDDLDSLPYDLYEKKKLELRQRVAGKLIVEEYPTSSASVLDFKRLLGELKMKRQFVPDMIIVDYLNIAASSRLKPGQTGLYQYVGAIIQELRGLAVEMNVPLWTATQVNRAGYTSSEVGLENTSESFGVPATADLIIALTRTEDLDRINQMQVKQLKNRYYDESYCRKFVIGVDRRKMKLFDVEQDAQTLSDDGQDDTPGFDKSSFGQSMKAEKKVFGGFKFEDDENDPF